MKRAAQQHEVERREAQEEQQRPCPRPARKPLRAAVAPGLRARRHGVRAYQPRLALLAALALCACGGPAGESGGDASQGLVLVRRVDGSGDLVRVRLRDGAERALTRTPGRDETWPYWSDTARSLVFQVSVGPGDSDLVLWTPEAGETPLHRTPGRQERWPAWSPRRPELVYAFLGGQPPSGLALSGAAPGEPRLLARGGERDAFLRPSWAPDGASLVVQRRPASGKGSELWVLRPGAEPAPLLRDPRWVAVKPCFSRDGRRILFSRRPASGGPHDIVSIDAGGGDARVVASLPDADDHSARPSPTRDELAFVSDREGSPRLYRADLDGGGLRRLGPEGGDAFAPRWSPDGERLVVTVAPPGVRLRLSDREGLEGARVVVLDRDGKLLLEAPGMMADWMPPWP